MVSFTVEAPELAKGVANALSFIPASSRLKTVYMTLDSATELRIIGTDTFAAGMETVAIRDYVGPPPVTANVDILIDKEDATALEKAARTSGKVTASITLRLGRLDFDPMGGDVLTTPLDPRADYIPTFHALLGLFANVEKRNHVLPGVICLDPSLLSRFAKVKTDKAYGRMADILFGEDELDRVLIKIGPNFKGLIMPIDREVNATNVGADGLW